MTLALFFWIAAAAAIGGTWCARALALRRGIVSRPNPIVPQHTRAVAYLGGLGVAAGIAVPIAAASLPVPLFIAVPAVLFLALGAADDLRPFAAGTKLVLQSAIALAAILLRLAEDPGMTAIDAVAGFLWAIALVNAFNVTDVCDGLVAGLSVPLFLAIVFLSPAYAPLASAAAGACLGFLVFNRPPATIFLGDAGSHLLGFLAAVLAPLPTRSFPAGMLVTGVFLFEMMFLIVIRTRKGLRWWMGSRDHFALRLQAAGLSTLQTDLTAIATGAVLAAMGVAAHGVALQARLALLALAVVSALLAGRLLLRWEVPQ